MKRTKSSKRPNTTPETGQASSYGILLVLVFLSGFAALVYQLLWFRQLALVFGNTVQATATVLAAFMVGLAWGAHRAKRWVARSANPLRLFGLIEGGIGVYALLVPVAFFLARLGYQQVAGFSPNVTPLLTGLRFVMALLVLFVPTMLMGASLPVLAEATLRSREKFAAKLGLLYGSNTAGATLGVLACGFLLVPSWGVRISNLLAAVINLSVGGIAIYLGKRATQTSGEAQTEAKLERSPRVVGFLGVAAVCGGLALAFETVWFRALTLVLGSTTYSFALMVGCFLLGLALGASLLGRLADKSGRAAWVLACALTGIGIWTLVSMRLFNAAPEYFLQLLIRFGITWNGMLLAKSAMAAIFLLPLAILSGMAFPAVVRLIRGDAESAGRAVSAAFSVNALGSAVGAALGGFVLLPTLGLERSLFVLGVVAVLVGLAIVCLATQTIWKRRLVFVGVVLVCVVAVRLGAEPWDKLALSSGPYFTPWAYVADGKVTLRERLELVELVYYKEGITSTIDVKATPDGRMFYCSDGKTEADSSPQSMGLQRMIGHLPMLFHPKPQRVLNIGLGAGVTAGALTCYPDAEIEVAEFEPAVTKVAEIWAARNHDLIRRGKFTLVVNDGRNHLLVTPNRYDVITADPFEPVVAGAANLYTVDYFQLARSRLVSGGMMAQFLPLYELSPEDFLIILRSFVKVFPRTSLFFTGADTVLLGITGEENLRLENAAAKMELPEVRASLAEVGVDHPERLLDMLVMDIRTGSEVVKKGRVHTDDLPIIEFSAPKSAIGVGLDANKKVLLDHFQAVPTSYLEGLSPDVVARVKRGHEGLRSALLASVLRTQGDLAGGLKLLREAVQLAPTNPIVRTDLSEILILAAKYETTSAAQRTLIEEALRVNPKNFWAIYHLIELSDAFQQPAKAEEYLRKGLETFPDSALLLSLRGNRALLAGDITAACRDWERVTQKIPRSEKSWREYAAVLKRAGRHSESEAALARAEKLRRQ